MKFVKSPHSTKQFAIKKKDASTKTQENYQGVWLVVFSSISLHVSFTYVLECMIIDVCILHPYCEYSIFIFSTCNLNFIQLLFNMILSSLLLIVFFVLKKPKCFRTFILYMAIVVNNMVASCDKLFIKFA
jgi:hypothetical protein